MKPEPVARTAPKRDPVKSQAGRVVFQYVMQTRTLDGLENEQIERAVYYLDGCLFLPTGGKKVERMLRARGKELNVL